MKDIKRIIVLILILTIFVNFLSANIYAKSKYIQIDLISEDTKEYINKDYIFEITKKDIKNELKIYDKKNKKLISKLDKVYEISLSDKKLFYNQVKKIEEENDIKQVDLMMYDLKSKQLKKIKSFSKEINLEYIKGEYIYISMHELNPKAEEFIGFIRPIYKINIKDGKQVKLLNSAEKIEIGSKKIFYTNVNYDVGPRKLFSSNMDGKGIKQIADSVFAYKEVGDNLYYLANPNYEKIEETYLYKANLYGEKAEKISKNLGEIESVISIDENKMVFIIYDDRPRFYKVDFETGKSEKISEQTMIYREFN